MINYLLQSIIVSAILSLAYALLFKRSKELKSRRLLLLSIPILSLSIPALKYVDFFADTIPAELVYFQMLDTIDIVANGRDWANSLGQNIIGFSIISYFVISAFLIVRLAIQIHYIQKLKKSSQKEGRVYFTTVSHNPFSFFKSIFINDDLKHSDDLPFVIRHEEAHIKQAHSLDIMYFELLKIVFWFNPFIYFLKQELVQVHEFLVDDSMLEQETNFEKYYNAILNISLLKPVTIGNNFNHSFTKIRFIMMTKNKNTQWLPVKVLALALIVAATSFAYAKTNQAVKTTDFPENIEASANVPSDTSRVFKFNTIDVKPEYPGGDQALMNFLMQNVKFPDEALKQGIQGKVYVGFIIDKLGNVTDVEVTRGVHPLLDNEAKRVVSNFPKWTPGEMNGKAVKVKFQVPINFKLSNKEK